MTIFGEKMSFVQPFFGAWIDRINYFEIRRFLGTLELKIEQTQTTSKFFETFLFFYLKKKTGVDLDWRKLFSDWSF